MANQSYIVDPSRLCSGNLSVSGEPKVSVSMRNLAPLKGLGPRQIREEEMTI